jgi:hypothetical protein
LSAAADTMRDRTSSAASAAKFNIRGEFLLKKVLLASTVAVALVFSASAVASLSPAAYKSKVNGICAKGVARLNAVPTPKTPAGLYGYFKTVSTLSDALLVKVKAVSPPSSLKASVGAAVSKQGAFQNALHALVAKLKNASNPKDVVTAAEPHLTSLNNAANKAWIAAGLVKCGS